MRNLIIMLLFHISTTAQIDDVYMFVDITNNKTNNIIIDVYDMQFTKHNSEIKFDSVVHVDYTAYKKILTNKYMFIFRPNEQYLVSITDTILQHQKILTVFTGTRNIDRNIIANFSINKQLAVAYDYTTNIYDYLYYVQDSVLKEEGHWEKQ